MSNGEAPIVSLSVETLFPWTVGTGRMIRVNGYKDMVQRDLPVGMCVHLPLLKIVQKKRPVAGKVAQLAKCLPLKYEDPSVPRKSS